MGSELYGIKQRSGRADILGAKSNIIYKYTKGIEEQIVKGKTKIQEVMIDQGWFSWWKAGLEGLLAL